MVDVAAKPDQVASHFLARALILAECAGFKPANATQLLLLRMYHEQGYSVATAVKAVFQPDYERRL